MLERAGSGVDARVSPLRQAGVRSLALLTADSETLVGFRGPLIDRLREDGVSVHYVGPKVGASTERWLADRAIPIHAIPVDRNSFAPAGDVRTFLELVRALRRIAPDAVLTTRVKTSVYGLLAARVARIKYRFTFVTGLGYAFVERPGEWRWRAINRIARALYAFGLHRGTAVAFQNPDDERDFRAWGILPDGVPSLVVGGSGVDTKHFAAAPLSDGPDCLFVGRLLADKGLNELIEAARIVKAVQPAATFTILGPTETNPAAFPMTKLQQAVAQGLVHYAGTVGDVRPYLAACRIFVLPSYREGTPRSVLEAMSMGRPIVTTDVPGCRETVEQGRNGLLVPPRDPAALAAAILELIRNPSRAAEMGRESRRIAEARYEVGKVTRELLNFYGNSALRSGV